MRFDHFYSQREVLMAQFDVSINIFVFETIEARKSYSLIGFSFAQIGIEDCECRDHKDLAHVHNLVPMYWEKEDHSSSSFSPSGVTTWLPEAGKPMETSLKSTVTEMTRLRMNATPVYIKAVLRESQLTANCDVR